MMNAALLPMALGALASGSSIALAITAFQWSRRAAGPPAWAIGLVAVGAIAGGWLTPRLLGPTLDERLKEASAAYPVLQKRYPGDYAILRGRAKAGSKAAPDLRDDGAALIADRLHAHWAELSDANADTLVSVLVDEGRTLRDRDPAACLTVLEGGPVKRDLSAPTSPGLTSRLGEAQALALEQIAARPAKAPPHLNVESRRLLIEGALLSLPRETSRIVQPFIAFQVRPVEPSQARAMCDYEIALYSEALRSPEGTVRSLLMAS